MRPVLIVTHLPDRDAGLAGSALRAAGCDIVESNRADGDRLPPLDGISGIVSVGGRESALDADRDSFLSAEVALMRDALRADVPVLGMCLGAQLLAVAAGGSVARTGRMYVGWPELVVSDDAAGDAVFGELPPRLPVLKWHEDVVTRLPADGAVLGSSEGPGAALFRVGSCAWGSQPHLELTHEMLVDGWLGDPADAADVVAAGHDLDEFRARSRELVAGQVAAARPMFESFGRVVAARSGAPAAAR
ncbi:MAG TPA: type 1 glutamine amidotransferase [Solirubrobacteraceae bacterium]|nr:type 1 glutamine amidotransferase [Solirubrobacteraceae bacterium]